MLIKLPGCLRHWCSGSWGMSQSNGGSPSSVRRLRVSSQRPQDGDKAMRKWRDAKRLWRDAKGINHNIQLLASRQPPPANRLPATSPLRDRLALFEETSRSHRMELGKAPMLWDIPVSPYIHSTDSPAV